MAEVTFTFAEAIKAQQALRNAAGLEPEVFEIEDVVGMASDEIEALLEQGKAWTDIAQLLQQATGKAFTAADVETYYVTPEERAEWTQD
jgi:hypothetical protein